MGRGRGAGTPCRKFGWCLPSDNAHEACPREVFDNMTQRRYFCECECHTKENDEHL